MLATTLASSWSQIGGRCERARRMASVSMKMLRQSGQRQAPPRRPICRIAAPSFGHDNAAWPWSVTDHTS